MQTIGQRIDNKICLGSSYILCNLSPSMTLQIVGNHPLSLGLSSL